MSKIKIYLFALVTLLCSSCIEQDELVFEKSVVEFDAATWEAKSVVAGTPKDYLLLSRVPKYGLPSASTDPAIRRNSGLVKFRVNLVGAHRSVAEVISYKVVQGETTAVAGTHFTTTGKVTIPANSSFGELEVMILDTGVSSTTPLNVVLELEGNSSISPNENYKRLGIQISQQ